MGPLTAVQPPDEGANAMIAEVMPHIGRFVHSFGIVEVSVAAWILKVEDTPSDAAIFLANTSSLQPRIGRLRKRLIALADAELTAVIEALDKVELYRVFRNDIAHGVIAYGDCELKLITWKNSTPIAPARLEEAYRAAGGIGLTLAEEFERRFGTALNLITVAEQAPPPVE